MSRRKIKPPKDVKKAMQSLGALEKLAELTQQLESVLKVNEALVAERTQLYEEIEKTLEDHHNDIEKLKKEMHFIRFGEEA